MYHLHGLSLPVDAHAEQKRREYDEGHGRGHEKPRRMIREILVHRTGTFKYCTDESSVRRAIDASQRTVNDTVEEIQYFSV
jgi:hypothetical protein